MFCKVSSVFPDSEDIADTKRSDDFFAGIKVDGFADIYEILITIMSARIGLSIAKYPYPILN